MRAGPDLETIRAARTALARYLPETRLVPATSVRNESGERVLLKLECELPTGSFKVRGAIYALSERLRTNADREVVAASTGNHGAAVAYAASLLGTRARIFLPQNPNPVKRARIEEYGAAIVESGRDIADASEAARSYTREADAYLLDDATDGTLPAGPATIALEILDRAPDVAELIISVGDTALIRGVAAAATQVRPDIRIIGVQAEQAPAYTLSWRSGHVVTTESCNTIADGLATRTPNAANVAAIRELVDDFVLVSEDELLDAVQDLLLDEHIVAEPAAAATFAALRKLEASAGPTALIISGGNLSKDTLRRAIGRDH